MFPIEGGKVLNLVAFVSDRSKDPDEREWSGRWVKPVSKEKMLSDFEGWDEKPVNLLKVRRLWHQIEATSSMMLDYSS